MAQMRLWRQGEVITHQRLNETVNAVIQINKDLYNGSGEGDLINNNSASAESLNWNDFSACKYTTSMWDQDGESIALDGWTCLSLCTPGVYSRINGAHFPVVSGSKVKICSDKVVYDCDKGEYRNYKCELKKIDCEKTAKAGDILWQKITINPTAKKSESENYLCSSLEIHCEKWSAPFKRWSSTDKGCFYTPLSRYAVNCANMAGEVIDAGVKSIAVNSTQLWPIPDKGQNLNLGPVNTPKAYATQSIAPLPTHIFYNNQAKEISDCASQFVWKQSVIHNGGGLEFFVNNPSKTNPLCFSVNEVTNPYIRSGVEFYGAEDVDINCSSPIPQWTHSKILAEWPIKEEVWVRTEREGVVTDMLCRVDCKGKIGLTAEPAGMNAWQIRFQGTGCIVSQRWVGGESGGVEGRDVRVKEHTCAYNWTDVSCTVNGNTTIYTINTVPRVLSPLEICGNGYLSIDIPELNDQLKPYYPVLCEHVCCLARIRLCKTNDGMRDIYKPILPQWLLDQAQSTTAYFPKGLHNATCGRNMTWAEMKGAGPIKISYSTAHGYGVTAMMIGDYLTFYID